jgi:hypothetical protein
MMARPEIIAGLPPISAARPASPRSDGFGMGQNDQNRKRHDRLLRASSNSGNPTAHREAHPRNQDPSRRNLGMVMETNTPSVAATATEENACNRNCSTRARTHYVAHHSRVQMSFTAAR